MVCSARRNFTLAKSSTNSSTRRCEAKRTYRDSRDWDKVKFVFYSRSDDVGWMDGGGEGKEGGISSHILCVFLFVVVSFS